MAELEIIKTLKNNTREFRNLSAQEQEWAKAHWKDMQFCKSVPTAMPYPYFLGSLEHFLRADYPEPAGRDLLAEAKNNRVPWKWLDPELKALMEKARANENGILTGVLVRLRGDSWTQYYGLPDGDLILRIDKDYRPPKPKPEPAEPQESQPPVIPGYRLAETMVDSQGQHLFLDGEDWDRIDAAAGYGAVGVVFWHPVAKDWMVAYGYIAGSVVLGSAGIDSAPCMFRWVKNIRPGEQKIVPAQYVLFPEPK